jgi:hypothetical protein
MKSDLEAHRLRNVYKPANIIAHTLKQALKNVPTLLLTATPLQNSILELFGLVSFIDDSSFRLISNPFEMVGSARCADRTSEMSKLQGLTRCADRTSRGDIPLGLYELPRRSGEAHLYRLAHPLAEAIIAQAKSRDLSPAEVRFDYAAHDGKVSLLKPLVGQSGWLTLSLFTVESLEQTEDHLIFATSTDGGQVLDEETARRLLTLSGKVDKQREDLIANIEGKLTQNVSLCPLFTIRWALN